MKHKSIISYQYDNDRRLEKMIADLKQYAPDDIVEYNIVRATRVVNEISELINEVLRLRVHCGELVVQNNSLYGAFVSGSADIADAYIAHIIHEEDEHGRRKADNAT